jgi:hypothetical protein
MNCHAAVHILQWLEQEQKKAGLFIWLQRRLE